MPLLKARLWAGLSNPATRERLAWAAVVAWTAVLYAAVPMARAIQRLVTGLAGGRDPFLAIVVAGISAAAVAAASWIWRRHGRAVGWRMAWLAAAGGAMVWMAVRCTVTAVEAVHFLEYGILGALLYLALACRVRDPLVYVVASLAGGLVGVTDEILQWLTPGRIFDFRDAAFNVSAVVLIQIAIAGGLAPAGQWQWPAVDSVRLMLRWMAGLLMVMGACFANTPARVEWYSYHVPGLVFLRDKPQAMVEYGYRHVDPNIGVFYSRFTLAQLRDMDRERGAAVGAILAPWRPHGRYMEFLKVWRPGVDPFVHEARVHLFSRDHHVGMMQQSLAARPTEKPAARRHAAIACREEQILRTYWSNTMAHARALLNPAAFTKYAQALEQRAHPVYVSPVSRHLITIADDVRLPAGVWVLALACVLGDRVLGRRKKQP